MDIQSKINSQKKQLKLLIFYLKLDKIIDYQRLDKDFGTTEYEFSIFSSVGELLKDYLKKFISISDGETEQEKFYLKLKKLIEYVPVTEKTISKRESFLEHIQNFYDVREMVIKAFKREIIPLEDRSYFLHFQERENGWIKNPE